LNSSAERVSVIIPLYNRKDYIEQTIRSVLNQTFSDWKLYIVDDGSTDGSRDVLTQFDDPRIVIIQHPGGVNKGQSASINLALANVGGEFISILDSDDYWESDKLAIQVSYLDANPDVGLVYCNGFAVDSNGNYLYTRYDDSHVETQKPESVLLDCYLYIPTNSMFRSSCLSKIGFFDETLRAAQDHDFAIRLAEVTKFGYVDKKVFSYRRHPNSISHMNADRRWRNGFVILKNAVERYPYPGNVIRKRKAVLYFRLAQCELEMGRYLSALKYLALSGINDPGRAISVLRAREKISSPH